MNKSAVAKSGFHKFDRNDGWGEQFGSFKVFFDEGNQDCGDEAREPGWYWQACFPGCLPDGEASGPFDTSTEAYKAACDY